MDDSALKKIINEEEGIILDIENTLYEDFALEQLKEKKLIWLYCQIMQRVMNPILEL